MDDSDTVKIIKQDLQFEIMIINLYYKNIFRIKDEKIRAILLRLLDDSLRHALSLTNILQNKLQEHIKVENEIGEDDLLNMLKGALEEEQEGARLYNEHTNVVESKDILHKIRQIFSDELIHEKLIKEMLDNI